MSYPINQIRFTTSSPLMITSYALISLAQFIFISPHLFLSESKITERMEIGLFTAALAFTAVNMMILLYIKSRKMPKQGINLGVFGRKTLNFGPIVFTIFQIIIMGLLIALFAVSNTTLSTTTKVLTIMALVVLNIGQILTVWSFSSIYCGSYNTMQQDLLSQNMGQYNMQPGYSGYPGYPQDYDSQINRQQGYTPQYSSQYSRPY
jgi:hypothetical protein